MGSEGFRCGGVVTTDTTREDLRERGMSEEAVDELMDMRDYLLAKEAGRFEGDYNDWRDRTDTERTDA